MTGVEGAVAGVWAGTVAGPELLPLAQADRQKTVAAKNADFMDGSCEVPNDAPYA